MRFFYFLLLAFICLFSTLAYAADKEAKIELQQVTLPDAIRLVAKHLNMNVILSPAIHGDTVFHVTAANPEDVLRMLLAANGLSKQRQGKVWLIAPQSEFIKWKQENVKWQEVNEAAAALQTRIYQLKYARAEEVAKVIHQQDASLLSPRGRIKVDERTNTIYIQDVAIRMQNIKKLINKLDVSVQQISIAARLVSIDCDFEQELGIQFSNRVGEETENKKMGDYALAVFKLPDHSFLDIKLAALENAGHAELISSPSLFASNQQAAVIEAGEEVPYQESSENGNTTVAFKKAVLGLKVTPQILPRNRILLQLQINQDRPGNKMVQGMPTISTRQIITSVLLKSGQTCVLGGIYEISEEKGVQGLPVLSHIPLLGLLFQQHKTRHNKRELLIFVTPRVIDEI